MWAQKWNDKTRFCFLGSHWYPSHGDVMSSPILAINLVYKYDHNWIEHGDVVFVIYSSYLFLSLSLCKTKPQVRLTCPASQRESEMKRAWVFLSVRSVIICVCVPQMPADNRSEDQSSGGRMLDYWNISAGSLPRSHQLPQFHGPPCFRGACIHPLSLCLHPPPHNCLHLFISRYFSFAGSHHRRAPNSVSVNLFFYPAGLYIFTNRRWNMHFGGSLLTFTFLFCGDGLVEGTVMSPMNRSIWRR